MRRIGIRWNSTKVNGLAAAKTLIAQLESHGVMAVPGAELAGALGCGGGVDDFADCEALFVLGGDGTILSSLDSSLRWDVPMLGINVGRLGFLSEAEPREMDRAIERVLAKEYTVDSRMTLKCDLPGEPFALNEAAFARSGLPLRQIRLEVFADGRLLCRVSGDGLVVSTPTGSTAYSLSAGGPVVSPDMDAILVTPICGQGGSLRPLVLPASRSVLVRAADGESVDLVLDGRREFHLPPCGVTICKGDARARFIRLGDYDFFSLLREKLTMEHWT